MQSLRTIGERLELQHAQRLDLFRRVDPQPPGTERHGVRVHLGAVQADRGLDPLRADRQPARLVGSTDGHHVGHHVIAEQRLGDALRIQRQGAALTHGGGDGVAQFLRRKRLAGIPDDLAVREHAGVDD